MKAWNHLISGSIHGQGMNVMVVLRGDAARRGHVPGQNELNGEITPGVWVGQRLSSGAAVGKNPGVVRCEEIGNPSLIRYGSLNVTHTRSHPLLRVQEIGDVKSDGRSQFPRSWKA